MSQMETAAQIIARAQRARYMLMEGAAKLAREADAAKAAALPPPPAPEPVAPPAEDKVAEDPFVAAKRIIREVSAARGLDWTEVVGERQWRPLALARQEIYTRMRDEIPHKVASLSWIGRRVGCRDHTTVLHGIKKHRERAQAEARQ